MSDVGTAVVAGSFALAGGFLGQYLYASTLARRAHRDSQLERLRQDRIEAYSAFASALVEYRRTQLGRWFAEHDGSMPDEEQRLARDEARLRRAAALDCFYRVRLLAGSVATNEAAREALDCTHAIQDAGSKSGATALADRVRDELLPRFVEASEAQVLIPDD